MVMTDEIIVVGDVIMGVAEDKPLAGLHRVLELIPRLDQATLIPIPSVRKLPGRTQANYYAKGFFAFKLSLLQSLLDTNVIKKTVLQLPGHWYLSDAELRKLSPPKDDPKLPLADRHRSPLEIKRDFKMDLIDPVIATTQNSGTRPPDLTCLDAMVRERAREVGVSAGQVFDALHRYYAFGCIKNALLPNTTGRSGAPGVPRRAKNHVKLGRKNAAVKAGNPELAGLPLTDADIQNIQDGFSMFVRGGTTVPQAFLAMSATFYSTGYTLKHGHLVPNLLEAHLRPTPIEFAYHGPRGGDGTGAARRLMGEGEWARNYRPLFGSVRDGIPTIGQVGSLDASPVDVNFVSCSDPLQPIGVGRGLFVRDAWSGLYLGWHVSLGGLGTDDAKLAILRAATDKSSILKRYNLDLPTEDFPSLFFTKYLSDNGELRSSDGIKSIGEELKSRIEFVASGRADRNSPSESGHHSRHRLFDHHLPGTTKGRQAKRGEPLPITSALLNRFGYTRLLLLWIHWANTKQELPLHMIPTEMRREFAAEGRAVDRTRIGIFRWAKANGYVSGKPVDPNYLRAHLLPKFTASVSRTGLVLHRPNTGNAVELLHGARFNHEYLAHAGIIRECIARGTKHIEVRADPDDLTHVLLLDKHGVHVIPNIKDDFIMVYEGGIADLCAINDSEKVHSVISASRRDQDGVDQQAFRQEATADAKETQKLVQKSSSKEAQPDRKRDGVRKARAAEKRAQLDDEIRRLSNQGPVSPPNVEPLQASAMPKVDEIFDFVDEVDAQRPRSAPGGLVNVRRARLAKFNRERKF
jgi:hypothetical protein